MNNICIKGSRKAMETGRSYKKKVICTDNRGKNIWSKRKDINQNLELDGLEALSGNLKVSCSAKFVLMEVRFSFICSE